MVHDHCFFSFIALASNRRGNVADLEITARFALLIDAIHGVHRAVEYGFIKGFCYQYALRGEQASPYSGLGHSPLTHFDTSLRV